MATSDKRIQLLAVGCTSEPPPGAGGIRQLGDNNGSVYGLPALLN